MWQDLRVGLCGGLGGRVCRCNRHSGRIARSSLSGSRPAARPPEDVGIERHSPGLSSPRLLTAETTVGVAVEVPPFLAAIDATVKTNIAWLQ